MIWYAIKRGIAWGLIIGTYAAIGIIAGHLIMVGS
jgi:hypothetical protein